MHKMAYTSFWRDISWRTSTFIGPLACACLLPLAVLMPNFISHELKQHNRQHFKAINEAILETLTSTKDLDSIRILLNDKLEGVKDISVTILDHAKNTIYEQKSSTVESIPLDRILVNRPHPTFTYDLVVNKHHVELTFSKIRVFINNTPTDLFIILGTNSDFNFELIHSAKIILWAMLIFSISFLQLIIFINEKNKKKKLGDLNSSIKKISKDKLQIKLDPKPMPLEYRDLACSLNEMLEKIQKEFTELSNFAYDVAHELQAPITNLLANSQITIHKSRTEKEYRETLQSNILELKNMSNIIKDMLLFAKSEHNQLKSNFVKLCLATEIRASIDFVSILANEKNIELIFSGDSSYIEGNRDMIRRVFINLLLNSIQHSLPNGKITVNLSLDKNKVLIAILNSCNTTSPDDLLRVFERFYQAAPSSNNGTGLGLAIVRSLLQFHNGEISAESAENKICIKITLPTVP